MSNFAVEQLFWNLNSRPEILAQYREQPEAVCANYALDETELELVRKLDVRALADRGASQMLLMMAYETMHGPQNRGEYFRRMNLPAGQF